MKKLIAIFILLSSVVAAENIYSRVFVFRFQNCLPYVENIANTDGANVSRQVIGWRDSLCRYKEITTNKDKSQSVYFCNFSRAQINELKAVMKADEPIVFDQNGLKYPSESSDALWAKYKMKKDVCLDLSQQ